MNARLRFSRLSASRLGRLALIAGIATGLAAAGPALAANAAPTAPTGDGWARVAHLSPDTKSVDVQLTALKGGGVVYELDDIAYGMVSNYLTMPAGNYVVSMVPSDAAAGTAPVIEQSITVQAGKPMTVAAYGTNKKLTTNVYVDDLTAPDSGDARIRVIQASTKTKSVDISTDTGLSIAKGATQGSSTAYASVPAGPWNLELSGAKTSSQAKVDLAGGSVSTLFVLDNAQGGVTVQTVLDSANVGQTPEGGIQTGGGALAHATGDQAATTISVVSVLALLASIAAIVAVRRRRVSAERR